MNTQEMMRIIDAISRDRNIDRQLLIADLEAAMVSAARRHFNTLDTEEFTCTVDPLTGQVQIFRHGEPLVMPPEAFGRIAAQTFKQVMIQRFREDERNSIFEEFSKRVGEIATGVAQRYEGARSSSRSIAPRRSCPAASRSRANSSRRATASAA